MSASTAKSTERRLLRTVRGTCDRYALLQPGDRVLLALSGGKDSYAMVHLLEQLRRAGTFAVEFVAVHLDQRQPGYDGRSLQAWLERRGVAYEILSEDTYSVVRDKLEPGATTCSLCSRLRRGILYSAAERLGCHKVALGHHRDDGLQTFLLNLLYSGKLQAMPASFRTDDGRFEVIRPLIDCDERDLREYAVQQDFPILPCNLCGSQEGLKRQHVEALLSQLERDNPHVRAIMAHALGNVSASHLLDPRLQTLWREHGPARTAAPHERTAHFAAQPIARRTLPLL